MSVDGGQEYAVELGAEISVETTSGDVTVAGVSGNRVRVLGSGERARVAEGQAGLAVRAASGGSHDLKLEVPSACSVRVRTVSGDIKLRSLARGIDIQTMSGDVMADEVAGRVVIHAVSGDVHLSSSRLDGLNVETVSGDTTVIAPLEPQGEYALRSVSGDLVLRVPEEQRLTVSIRTLSGDVRCELPHVASGQGWGKREVAVNGGGVVVAVHTTSGDVRVRAEEGASAADDRPAETQAAPRMSVVIPEQALAPGAIQTPWEEPARGTRPLDEAEPAQPFVAESDDADAAFAASTPAARRMSVLKAIEEGRLSVGEGLEKLRELE
jgi:DUF4097 and DUF4098 domain-containing protein YvlB